MTTNCWHILAPILCCQETTAAKGKSLIPSSPKAAITLPMAVALLATATGVPCWGFLAKLGGCISLAFGFAKQCKGRSKTTCLKYTWGHAPGQKWCWWGYRCMASQEETGPQQFSTATKSPGKEQWYWWLNQIYIESCQGCCMLHLWISESHGAVQLMAFSMPRCPWVSLCHYVRSDGNCFVPHVAEGTSKVWHKTQKTYNRMYAST